MRLSTKLLLTLLAGINAVSALFYFQSLSKNYYTHRDTIELTFKRLDILQKELDATILTNGFFLYTNQDETIYAIENLNSVLNSLFQNQHLIGKHTKTYPIMLRYQKAHEIKINAIYDFQTAGTVIKNSTVAIPLLYRQLLASTVSLTKDERDKLQKIAYVNGTLLVAKNAIDAQLIQSLRSNIDALASLHFSNTAQNETFKLLISHFNIILQTFPRYSEAVHEIKFNPLDKLLKEGEDVFLQESADELRFITYFSYFLVVLFISSLLLITFFLIQGERESRTDRLTGLGNRRAYEERIKNSRKDLGLILINIRKFKNYNDFYGISEGDKLLIETAKRIRNIPFNGVKPTYYRLGADDFGILFELSPTQSLEALSKEILVRFSETPITINTEIRTPAIAVVASASAPLLETADMALKNKKRSNPTVYHEDFNFRKNIEESLIKHQELKEALREHRIVPYFQPIVDLSNGKVVKHEVLARIIVNTTEAHSIFPYLMIAKEFNLYAELTRIIIAQSFTIINEYGGDFSINLSIDDITDIETVKMIEKMLQSYQNIGKRIIFELLESETIEEYDEIVQFIALVRGYGCRIAIDDFGIGYSNFSRILNLTVDIIKIDGSLIRHLDTDAKAITIVQTIVNFTKIASIETVAEFVHSKAIADIASELGIDAAQGVYFYEPAPLPLSPMRTSKV